MKNLIVILLFTTLFSIHAQYSVKYNPALQPTGNMQYFAPAGTNLFVGDCIPFYHDNTYYLYWLIDSAHHSALNGLGGHQWVLSTSKDLKTWMHHPVVLGIDEEWEKSICTGSLVYYDKTFYAFYATRNVDASGKWRERLSYAISNDGIHFVKQKPNPFYEYAPSYSKESFRDPKVLVDADGTFHLFVSSQKENPSINGTEGCLVHITSKDLKKWDVKDPLITGQGSVPECPDYFFMNGWYYLLYSDYSTTYYVMSRHPYGPWVQPKSQVFAEEFSNVVKTAEFNNGRRIAAGWISNRKNDEDKGWELFGGNVVFREIIQETDGTLSSRFPAEMLPIDKKTVLLNPSFNASLVKAERDNYTISSPNGIETVAFGDISQDCHISFDAEPIGENEEFGLYLRADQKLNSSYKLSFSDYLQQVKLFNTSIYAVSGLNLKNHIDIVMKGNIIDVCIGGKRCIINRLCELKGKELFLFVKHGTVKFSDLRVYTNE